MSTRPKSPRRAPQVRNRTKETLPESSTSEVLVHEWPQPWAVVDELSGLLGKVPNVKYSMSCANPYADTVLSYVKDASGGLLNYKQTGDISSEYELRPPGEMALFPHQIPRGVEADLLTRAGCVNYPKRLTPDEAHSLETPCIVKNPFMQRGEGVVLVEPGEELRAICDQLGDGSRYPNIIIEEFIRSPGDFPVTFRVTAIPTGQVIGVTLKVGGKSYDEGGYLSNVAQGGTNYPLRLTGADRQYAASVDPKHVDSLVKHGIDIGNMNAPMKIVEEASRIAEVLGRNYGVVFGIDLVLGEDGRLRLLEINNAPSPDGVIINGRSMGGRPEEMYKTALQRLCGDLALRNAG